MILSKPYTEKVDVYSFGILIWTLATNTMAFEEIFRSGKNLLKDFHDRVVVDGERPPIETTWPGPIGDMIRGCWDAESEKRPSFAEVAAVLREQISGGRKNAPNSMLLTGRK